MEIFSFVEAVLIGMKFQCKEEALGASPELLRVIIHYITCLLVDNALYNIQLINNILSHPLPNVENMFSTHIYEAKLWSRFLYELVEFAPHTQRQTALSAAKHT